MPFLSPYSNSLVLSVNFLNLATKTQSTKKNNKYILCAFPPAEWRAGVANIFWFRFVRIRFKEQNLFNAP
jgi:hypothetical protein